jgi:hypothetical protein
MEKERPARRYLYGPSPWQVRRVQLEGRGHLRRVLGRRRRGCEGAMLSSRLTPLGFRYERGFYKTL